MKDFFAFAAIQFVMFGLLTWNYRMVAQANYSGIAASDLVIAGLNFAVIKRVSEAKTKAAWAGYTIGGAFGSVFAAWLTKLVYGQ